VDQSLLPEVMGTVAGDDTILVIPRGGYTTNQVAEALCNILPRK
jgi:arginine repressor